MSKLLAAGILGAVAASGAVITAKISKQMKKAPSLPEGFTVTAHTGCEMTKDNSMECLKKSIDIGASTAEVDVTFREDGTPVLLHKKSAGASEGVPFEEAVKFVSENSDTMMFNLDMKSFKDLTEVVRILEKYNMKERCLYTGVEAKDTQSAKLDGGGIPYYLNAALDIKRMYSDEEIKSVMYEALRSGAVGINCNYIFASEKLVRIFHENSLKVSFWTANTKPVMKYLLTLAPDNITTRFPSVMETLV